MTTYNWNCRTVDAYPQDGIYTDVVDITSFIPFEDLTNEEVVTWTKSAMGEEEVAAIETNIENQIDSLINPTSVTLTIV